MISATILTHNSLRTIVRCVESVIDLVEEVIIVDDFSTDGTLDLLKKKFPSCRVFQRELNGDFSAQRNFSLEKCSFEWALIIDSDEELTQGLKENIRSLKLEQVGSSKIYSCFRLNQNIAGWSEEKMSRPILMPKNVQWQSSIHEQVEGRMTYVGGHLLHHSWEGMVDFIDEINKYTTWKTDSWINQSRSYGTSYLVARQTLNALYLFCKRYFYEKRFKFGAVGFLYCLAWASEELFVGLKFYENSIKDKESL